MYPRYLSATESRCLRCSPSALCRSHRQRPRRPACRQSVLSASALRKRPGTMADSGWSIGPIRPIRQISPIPQLRSWRASSRPHPRSGPRCQRSGFRNRSQSPQGARSAFRPVIDYDNDNRFAIASLSFICAHGLSRSCDGSKGWDAAAQGRLWDAGNGRRDG